MDKTRKTIERFEKQLQKRREKLEAQGVDLSNFSLEMDKAQRQWRSGGDSKLYWDLSDYEDNLENISRNKKKLLEQGEKLKEYIEKRAAEEKRNEVPHIPALEEFLAAWKVEAAEWCRYRSKALAKFEAERKAKCQEIAAKYAPQDFLHRKEIEAEEKAAGVDYQSYLRKKNFNFSQDIQRLALEGKPGDAKYEAALEQMLSDDVDAKRLDLYVRCTKAVGVITDASGLDVGNNGSLNGYIKGENGMAHVETIMAGGYNIQCLHYRVMVKPIQPLKSLDAQIQDAADQSGRQQVENEPHSRKRGEEERT